MFDSQRANVIRTLSLFFIVWSIFGPIDTRLIEFKSLFFGATIMNSIAFLWILKALVLTSSIALIRWPTNLALSGTQLVTGSVFLSLGVVSNSLWNYNTHILIISVLTFIAGFRIDTKLAQKDLTTALSLIFGVIYYQAAFSKMVVSGIDWMNTGLSIYTHMIKFNPALSALIDGHRVLFQMAGWLTVIGEFVLGTLFVIPKTRKLAAVVSFSFHMMLWSTFHISFWHLWIFYPAIYLAKKGHLVSTRKWVWPLSKNMTDPVTIRQ